jgi:hypothetical protein
MPDAPIPYLAGKYPKQMGPLARYLPNLPAGSVSFWLSRNLDKGSLVLDPFGSSPRLAVEVAQAGYRILVAANNPVIRALLELEIDPPPQQDMLSVLAELASSFKGSERIEPHIQDLYETECAQCHASISAECFLWEKQAPTPYGRIYHCPYCGDSGEHPTTQSDRDRSARYGSGGLHRARALERVAPPNDPDRNHAEEALSAYPPRAVYALFTLINKLDALVLSPVRRGYLAALLLHACDMANTLWPHPTGRERPRQLTVPPRYRENNVWLAIERGVQLFTREGDSGSQAPTPVPHNIWPAHSEENRGEVILFEGRLKDLSSSLKHVQIGAVIAALPRPNQAFWTLSALWSGWLWGRDATGSFKSVLRRRRYDWAWHTAALSASLENMAPVLPGDTPLLFLTSEAEPGLMAATFIATANAGLTLNGMALRAESGQAQVHLKRPQQAPPSATIDDIAQAARRAAIAFLCERGQPAPYLSLQAAALVELSKENLLQIKPSPGVPEDEPKPAQYFSRLQTLFKDIFTYRNGFVRYEGSDQSLEIGLWWLRNANGEATSEPENKINPPLADRVEETIVRFLIRSPQVSFLDIETHVLETFPGLQTPETDIIGACLQSYGMEDPPGSGRWLLATHEAPSSRRQDLESAQTMLIQLGQKLGFLVEPLDLEPDEAGASSNAARPYLWKNLKGKRSYLSLATATACLGKILPYTREFDVPVLLALPGSRSNLALYKLHGDPRIRSTAEKNWFFIKYRHLRRLVEMPNLTVDNLEELLKMDPLTTNITQMRLL